jgi:SnoaL-like protein
MSNHVETGLVTQDVARRFLDALGAQDFERLAAVFADDVHLRALLPADSREWDGVERVTKTFVRWFGDTEDFALVDAGVEELASRLHMWWRARLRAERLGDGWFVVEQQAYVDTNEGDRIRHLSLVCTGYLTESPAP